MTAKKDFPIVGVGASAGGVEALEGFFRGMPSSPGLAIVIVTHLSPDRKSMLPEIVARYTSMPVVTTDNGMRKALAGSKITISSEQYGDWSYNKGKQVCESLMLSNPNPDGIWSSGGDMSRACAEVFKEFGKPVPPITGEGNNGFMRAWKTSGATSMAALFPSEQGAAGVRAAVALLSGESLHKRYVVRPAPVTKANFDQFYRADLNDNYWAPSTLSDADLKKFYGSK